MVEIPVDILDPNQDAVGILSLPPTSTCPPLKIYYPCERSTRSRPSGWFGEEGYWGAAAYLMGYASAMSPWNHTTLLFQWAIRPLVYLLAFISPLTWKTIPGLYLQATPQQASHPIPLVLFSHGMMGTGNENALLCTAWAKQGMMVVSIHHTDGSSCRVRLAKGTIQYYDPGPPPSADPSFRPKQALHRAQEMMQALTFFTTPSTSLSDISSSSSSSLLPKLLSMVDPERVVLAGYSYGASTVARTIALVWQGSCPFKGVLLLDGWFGRRKWMDVQATIHRQTANPNERNTTHHHEDFSFPSEAFDLVDQTQAGLPLPSLFLMSEAFRDFSANYQATQRLAGFPTKESSEKPDHHEILVIPGTGHMNFMEAFFWRIGRNRTKQGRTWARWMGTADPLFAYRQVIDKTTTFLLQVTTPTE